ncbi:MAG: C4-type zinc ribbon domain-containing protein, partial [Planctomycetota bacterium]
KRKVASGKEVLGGVEDEITACRLNIDKGELNIKELEEAIQKSNIAMNGAKTNTEYSIFQEQIAKNEENKGAKEEEVLELLTLLENLQGRKTDVERDLADMEKSYQRKETEVLGLVTELEEKVGGLKENRGQLAEEVITDHLDLYERINKKVDSDCIVAAEESADEAGVYFCQGCYMTVTKQELNQLALAQDLLTCRSCSRLLYLED